MTQKALVALSRYTYRMSDLRVDDGRLAARLNLVEYLAYLRLGLTKLTIKNV